MQNLLCKLNKFCGFFSLKLIQVLKVRADLVCRAYLKIMNKNKLHVSSRMNSSLLKVEECIRKVKQNKLI